MKIKKIEEPVSFTHVTYAITFETQEELDEARGVLNYSPITEASKFLDSLSEIIGYDDNEFFRYFENYLLEK